MKKYAHTSERQVFNLESIMSQSSCQNIERSLLSTAATGWKQIISQEFAMFNQIQTLGEVVDKIDNKEEGFNDRSKFDLERSFSVSVHTPAGSPYTGKSRSESCKSRNSFSSRHSSLDSHLDDRTSSMTTSHYFSQAQVQLKSLPI